MVLMLILVHVIIAITSCVCTSYIYFSPSRKKITTSYFLIAATLGTGSYLIMSKPSHMVQSCIVGILYICFVTAVTILARLKISRSEVG
jgi:hypothetical protein